jgi:ABC-type Na+ efflux pump permease subunit
MMSNPKLLVALREFRQITSTRSFWITLMILPLAIAASQFMARYFRPPPTVAYVLVDETGRYAPVIRQRVQMEEDRKALADLSSYADKWKIKPGGQAVWGQGARWYNDADVARFEAAGGMSAAQAEVAKLKPSNAPAYKPPEPGAIAIDPPAGVVTTQGAQRFGETLTPNLKANVQTPQGPRALALAVYVPADFGEPGVSVRMWTNGTTHPELSASVREVLNQGLRLKALQASGLDLAALGRIQTITAPVQVTVPPVGSGRERMMLQSALPLALSYLLLMSLMISGSWMLQGVVEERSNKLIEAVLACIRPDDLLYGKLIGILGVGLVLIAAWVGFAVVAAFAFQGAVADVLRPMLSSVSSPGIILALVYYFAAGYLCIATLFLAIGSVSDSMRDAQGYLTPLILALTLPFVAVVNATLLNPDGPIPKIFSWIPLWAPFAMMARLGTGVAPWELIGSGALLAAFIVLELWAVGRIFRASLLQTGQSLKLRDFGRLIMAEAT